MNSVYSRAKRSLYSNAGRWFPQPWFLPPPGGTWKRQSLGTRPGPDNSDTLGGTVRSAAIKPGGCGGRAGGGVCMPACAYGKPGAFGDLVPANPGPNPGCLSSAPNCARRRLPALCPCSVSRHWSLKDRLAHPLANFFCKGSGSKCSRR